MFGQATIPNQSFELWEDIVVLDSLDYWYTSTLQAQQDGQIDAITAYETNNAYLGASALHLETILWYDAGAGMNDTIFGYAVNNTVNGSDFVGFPYSDTVDVFSCWYKCGIQPGDQGLIVVELSKNNVPYSTTTYPITGNVGTWTQLNIPLISGSTEEPDSVFIGFVSSDPFTPGVPKPGSWLEVDALSFNFVAGSVTPGPIPNNSFENWTREMLEQPQYWFSFDPMFYTTLGQEYVSKSTTAMNGSYSMRVESTIENMFYGVPSLVTNGWYDAVLDSIVGGDAFNAQPAQVTGMYQYMSVFSDTAYFIADFWNSTSGIHVIEYDTLLHNTSWTPFAVDLTFAEAPDSVQITFFAGTNGGSFLLVDNLQFVGGDVNVDENNKLVFSIFPNPANDFIQITISENSVVNIFDFNGKLIYQNSTSQNLMVPIKDWNNGIYVIQVIENGRATAKKLVVQH